MANKNVTFTIKRDAGISDCWITIGGSAVTTDNVTNPTVVKKLLQADASHMFRWQIRGAPGAMLDVTGKVGEAVVLKFSDPVSSDGIGGGRNVFTVT